MIVSTHSPAGSMHAPAPAVVWEETACPLCAGSQSAPLLEAPDAQAGRDALWFAVVRCDECGLCYTNPRPNAATIGPFYPSQYRPHRRKRYQPPRGWHPLAALGGRPRVERRALPWHGQGRLLDFGCGGGSFLERMARQGWHVTGLDTSPEAVRRVRAELGVPVLLGTLPHPDLVERSFDVVTMWHSLEHVHAPLMVLKAAWRLLAPGGRLLVAVPNLGGWPFRWFGPAWFALDLPRHLTHFEPATLRRMLERAGFANVTVRMVRHTDWLRSSARLACRMPEPAQWQRLLTVKPLARLAAWACYVAGRSDCMLASAERPASELQVAR